MADTMHTPTALATSEATRTTYTDAERRKIAARVRDTWQAVRDQLDSLEERRRLFGHMLDEAVTDEMREDSAYDRATGSRHAFPFHPLWTQGARKGYRCLTLLCRGIGGELAFPLADAILRPLCVVYAASITARTPRATLDAILPEDVRAWIESLDHLALLYPDEG